MASDTITLAGQVVELDQEDRAVDAVVERALLAMLADPAEIGLRQVLFYLVHADLGMAWTNAPAIELD